MTLNARSLKNLEGVHPDLCKVVHKADDLAEIAGLGFIITEGCRTYKRQQELVAAGASQTMKSRHIPGTNGFGHAIDFAPLIAGTISWKWPAFTPLVALFKQASKSMNIPIECGADWLTFKDGPHIQLPWAKYP